MIIDKQLHRTFIAQINSMIVSISRRLDDKRFTYNNAYEYKKQFDELKASIFKVDQYSKIHSLLNLDVKLPSRFNFFISHLFGPALYTLNTKGYFKKVDNYFSKICDQLKTILDYLKTIEIE